MRSHTSGTRFAAGGAYRARHVRRLAVDQGVRPVRIVHTLDGMDGQVTAETLLTAGDALWQRWNAHPRARPHDVLLGLDAGGILPTVALSLASGSAYRLAWKLDLDLPDKMVFHEAHANRTQVFTYGSFSGQRVLLVDDEVTTGHTVASLAGVLRADGADVVGVACLVEDLAGGGRQRLDSLGIPLCALTTL